MEENKNEPWNFHTCQSCPYRTKSGFIMYKHQILHDLHRKQSKTHTFVCYAKAPEIMNCEFCDFSSLLKVNLTEHFRVVHEEKEANEEIENILKCHRCEYCDFETHSVVVLTKHMSGCNSVFGGDSNKEVEPLHEVNDMSFEFTASKGVNWFKCEQCAFKTTGKVHLQRHIVGHVQPNPKNFMFECNQCSFNTIEKRHLRQHAVRMHSGSNWVKCGLCAFTTQLHDLHKHIMANHSRNKVSVSGIDKWYEFTTPEGVQCLECKHCVYTTNESNQMMSHMILKHLNASQLSENDNWHKLVTPEGITWLKCKQCALMTKEFKTMESHILFEHANAENTKSKCPLCEFKTEKERSLQQHILVEHVKRDRSRVVTKHVKPETVGFKGKQCPQDMETHVLLESVKEATDLFKCTQCAYQTKFENNLSLHIAAKHTKNYINKYECKQCEFKTNVECILHRHIVARHNNNKVGNDQWYEWTTPDGVRLFKCKECDFIINKIEDMRKHAAVEHTLIVKRRAV